MSPRNYHQIECQQDRETEREIRSCRIDHHQLTLCPLPRWRVDCWCYKSSFISKERAQCVLYSAPMLDLIETWAAGGSQQYLNLTDSSWNWSLVMSDAAINSCCPQIGCCVVIRSSIIIRLSIIRVLNDMKPWHWDDERQRQNIGRCRLGVVLFIVC